MGETATFSKKLYMLTPCGQRAAMKRALREHSEAIGRMNEIVEKIPMLGETDTEKYDGKHPLSLHFFAGGSDWYITEWDRREQFFGYVILNDDVQMSEWGYISTAELEAVEDTLRRRGSFVVFNLDFHCEYKTVEEALFNRNPDHFAKYNPALPKGEEDEEESA